MNGKRRDNKNRVLRNGESQRKNGQYLYKYFIGGKPKFVYSWKLVPTDAVPKGKRGGLSLREKEKQIQKDLLDGIVPDGGGMSVLGLVQKHVALTDAKAKTGTRSRNRSVISVLEKEPFGQKRIDRVRLSDAMAFAIRLHDSNGLAYETIRVYLSLIRMAFKLAVNDDLIRKNPFDFRLSDVLEPEKGERVALSNKQEQELLAFIQSDSFYFRDYDVFYILFNTGLRISEFCGLTLADIDLQKREIRINHQLLRDDSGTLAIAPPKSKKGNRTIPMMDGVFGAFKRIMENRNAPKTEPLIGGRTGFLFFDRKGLPRAAAYWEQRLRQIVKKYNKSHDIHLPNVTPHVCRHTFCTNMALAGMNPKALQYLMGHQNISTTLNVYTHMGFTDARKELERVLSGDSGSSGFTTPATATVHKFARRSA